MWTFEEDVKLVEALVELTHAATYKADQGFKPGFLGVLEKELASKLPGHGLKGEPHIKSRMKTLKKEFNIVHEMIYGHNASGFGWDDAKKCVVAEKPVWDVYLASHKDAVPFVNRSFPLYDDLYLVFGKDRATGKIAQSAGDMLEDVNGDGEKEGNTNGNDMLGEEDLEDNEASVSVTQRANYTGQSEGSSGQKRRRRNRSANDIGSSIMEAAALIGSKIEEATDRFSKAIGLNVAEMRKRINDELTRLPGVTMGERHRALRILACDPETTEIFFTLPDHEKEPFVVGLLCGEI